MKKMLKGLVAGVFALALTFSTPLETKASDWLAPCGHEGRYQRTLSLAEATCTRQGGYFVVCTKCNSIYEMTYTGYAHSWTYYNSHRRVCVKCGHSETF